MFLHMAEYCDAPQSKERRNREYKVCLNESAILRLLDHGFVEKTDAVIWQAEQFICPGPTGSICPIL